MDFNEVKKELRQVAHTDELKPNPHKYPIIDKWNYKYVIRPHKHDVFSFVEKTIEKYMEEQLYDRIRTANSTRSKRCGES